MATEIEALKKALPKFEITDLQGHGANIYLPDRIITAYWKRKKYGDNKTNAWLIFKNIPDLLSTITMIVNTPEEDVEDLDQAIIAGDRGIQARNNGHLDDVGTQACIDHIQRKYDTMCLIESSNENNQTGTILKIIMKELKQYL